MVSKERQYTTLSFDTTRTIHKIDVPLGSEPIAIDTLTDTTVCNGEIIVVTYRFIDGSIHTYIYDTDKDISYEIKPDL